MTAKLKKQMAALVLELRDAKRLSAEDFFKDARDTAWGMKLTNKEMAEGYAETLGRLTAQGELSFDQAEKASKVI